VLAEKRQLIKIFVFLCALFLTLNFQQKLDETNILWAAVPRFGVDEQNSRCVHDPLTKTGFPFRYGWSVDLGGQVESQPIFAEGSIYVQAGQRLLRLSYSGEIVARSPVLSEEMLPSGSSPTYALTKYGKRIYQATRDHRLWALDSETLQPVWQQGEQEMPYIVLSAGGQPEKRYRITSSPLVVNQDGKVWIALGTANGDGTDKPEQYADNGFFIIEDEGRQANINFSCRLAGEVTGSPVWFDDEVLGTQNTVNQPGSLIRFDFKTMNLKEDTPLISQGIPGSPAVEGQYLYLAERNSRIICYEKTASGRLLEKWINPAAGDKDYGRADKSYNLKSPVIGNKYLYLPVQDYNGIGRGAVIAVDKETGLTHKVKILDSPICANLIAWQPAGRSGEEYILALAADGTAMLLDGKELEPVYGFINEAGEFARKVYLLPQAGLKADPEPVIADNLLLLVDGQGVMHAYIGEGPINFLCYGSEIESNTREPAVAFTVANQSRRDYEDIPFIIRGQMEADARGQSDSVLWSSDLYYETNISLAAGEVKKLVIELPTEALGKKLLAEINPIGHPGEKQEEIYPRDDNRYLFEANIGIFDLEVVSFTGPAQGTLGKRESLTAAVRNLSEDELKQVPVCWYQDGRLIRREEHDFAPGETKMLNWLWQSPREAGIVQLKIWVDPEGQIPETNRLNNQKDLYITFVERASLPDCSNVLEEKTWPVVYSRITGYQTRQRIDCSANYYGKLECRTVNWTDYSSPIWENVTVYYSESLSATATVNTGQGRATENSSPKPEDRESRGSWAIIPYAKANNLDPNEVTRAGYGFTLTVKTNYQTDWERKIPYGLAGTPKPIGGSFNGPTAVIAEFYDTRGDKVSEVALERTGGTAGVGEAVWELPLTAHRYLDGSEVRERKHYTAADIPDGDYYIVIKVMGAGKNNLHTCKIKKVRIYGTMYDDQYNRLGKNRV